MLLRLLPACPVSPHLTACLWSLWAALQDTMQAGPLAATMVGMMFANPRAVSRVLLQVGDWRGGGGGELCLGEPPAVTDRRGS